MFFWYKLSVWSYIFPLAQAHFRIFLQIQVGCTYSVIVKFYKVRQMQLSNMKMCVYILWSVKSNCSSQNETRKSRHTYIEMLYFQWIQKIVVSRPDKYLFYCTLSLLSQLHFLKFLFRVKHTEKLQLLHIFEMRHNILMVTDILRCSYHIYLS